MAPSSAARKAPVSTRLGLVPGSIADDIFTVKERKPGTIKLKKSNPKQVKPGNWKESEINYPDGSKNTSSTPLRDDHNVVNRLDNITAANFATGQPIEDSPEIVQCKHCKKPILRSVAAAHIKECLNRKQEKLKKKKEAKEAKDAAARKERDGDSITRETPNLKALADDPDAKPSAKKSAIKASLDPSGEGGSKKGKKRKADDPAGGKEPKAKKKKDEPKTKAPKPKGPVDVERQCGVKLPNGQQCARSLTCKSHSMGAKRAVPGRSLPYDRLLAQYQKKNQAKQQKAAIDANAPLLDDFETGTMDSDEEKDAIMAAIARSRPLPLVPRTYVPTRHKYQYVRLKEMLANALGGARGGGLFSVAPVAETPAPINTQVAGMRGFFANGLPSAGPMSAGVGGDAALFGAGGFGSPLASAGLDGGMGMGEPSGSRRSSVAQHRGMSAVPGGGGFAHPGSRQGSIASHA